MRHKEKSPLTLKKVQKFFDITSDYYNNERNRYLQNQRAEILKKQIIGPNVLDIGVNTGDLVKQYYDFQSDINLFGIDLSLICLKKAHLRIPNARFICANGQNLCFKECFQTVIISESIYYMNDPLCCIKEIYRCLSKNAKIIIICSSSLLVRIRQFIETLFKIRHKDIVGKTFSPQYISKLLYKAGFVRIKYQYFNLMPFKGGEFVDQLIRNRFGFFSVVIGIKIKGSTY